MVVRDVCGAGHECECENDDSLMFFLRPKTILRRRLTWLYSIIFPSSAAGEVYEVGPGVQGLKKGDRVAIEAGLPCGDCAECRGGRYNACKDVVFFSTPPYHGLLTRYHAHPASWVHRLPDNISFEEGALLEPLVVALAGIERSGLKLGDPLLIW